MMLSLVPLTKDLAKAPFDCGIDELNKYLRHYAVKNDLLSIGKSFVALTQDQRLAGYITISTAQIIAETLSIELQARLPRYPVPAFRIGKLAVDKSMQGSGVGRWLLRQALEKAVTISSSVGLFAVVVDAIDEQAKKFYEKFGFTAFSTQPQSLFLPLATIKAAMNVEP